MFAPYDVVSVLDLVVAAQAIWFARLIVPAHLFVCGEDFMGEFGKMHFTGHVRTQLPDRVRPS
jgi:hypothetical protein